MLALEACISWPCDWDVKLATPGNTTVEVQHAGAKLKHVAAQPPQRASAITFLNNV
jgi:hypothetical protein